MPPAAPAAPAPPGPQATSTLQPPVGEVQGGETPPVKTVAPQVRCPRPSLRVTLAGPAKVIAGQQTTLAVRLQNRGEIIARNVLLADVLPEGFSLVKSSKPYAFRSGSLKVRVGTLGAGKTFTLGLTLKVSRSAAGQQVNAANVTAQCTQTAASRPVRVSAVEGALTPAVTG